MNRVLVFVMYVKSIAVNAAIKAVSLSFSLYCSNEYIHTNTHIYCVYVHASVRVKMDNFYLDFLFCI